MIGVTFEKARGKWIARSNAADGNHRLGSYDTEWEAEAALVQYYKDGLFPLPKRRGKKAT